MQVPLEIQFRNMQPSDAVEAAVRRRVEKLERLADPVIRCRVIIEAPHRHHRHGNLYSVSVDLRQAGRETLANRTPQASHEHEDVYVAIRDAFLAARRQILKHLRTSRGDVKLRLLDLGADVRFAEETDDEGPQANSVHVAGKRHASG